MRSMEELKQQWLAEVSSLFARPEMYARSGPEMELVAGGRLRDLCFLDGRDDEFEQVVEALRGFGKLGVHGPFAAIFGQERRCTAEVASVYAEHYHRLGYLTVDRLLDSAGWSPMSSVADWVADRDVHRSEVEAAFGPPSCRIGKRVWCYAPADGGGWVFFDCWDEAPQRYVPNKGTFDREVEADPLVRDIRIPADDFDSSLVLTLYGRVLRWGPGWWIHRPSDATSEQTKAIAAQLQQIEAADPSQGRRR
ncbi:hypothetical protein [Nocardia sp. NPDC049707]|uniref:hypothetical protein n=1 Tax=Nocardia sp. NPDC049707 TaxID=3154735 RepID=UPI003433D93D